MKKIAIFVEGQTELIITREFLLRKFAWSGINIICRKLHTKSKFVKAEYDYPAEFNEDADFLFQIINVGNDVAVLSRILKLEKYMKNAGFVKIVGLRDMYSKSYREETSSIDIEVIRKFITTHKNMIRQISKTDINIKFCFAIMEVEAWFLGMDRIFQELHNDLTNENINEQLRVNLGGIDPEKEIYHPAKVVEDIYNLVDMKYDKKKGDIEAIANLIDIDDYEDLYLADKCKSFNYFYDKLEEE